MVRKMKIGYIQTAPIFGEKEKNFQQINEIMKKIDQKADLIVLPELFATGYTFISKNEAMDLSEEINGETYKFLQNIAKQTGAIIVGGFIEKDEKDENKIYNSALMVTDNNIIGVYRKIHLFNKEKLWFSSGNQPFKVYDVKGVKIGMMICFDWIFPESVRTLAILEADVIAHSANLVLPYCQNAMVTRCLSNKVFAVTANRIGKEERGKDSFNFTGRSQITSYNGDILSSAPSNKSHIDIVDIDIENSRNKNLNEYNNLFEDRKKEFYY